MLIRIDVNAGHAAGKPTSKMIDEATDIWSFVMYNLGMPLNIIGLPSEEDSKELNQKHFREIVCISKLILISFNMTTGLNKRRYGTVK